MNPFKEIMQETVKNAETLLEKKEKGKTLSFNIERIEDIISTCSFEESEKENIRIEDLISKKMKDVGIDFLKTKESLNIA